MNRGTLFLVCLASASLMGLSAAGAESGPRPTAPPQPPASTPNVRTAGSAATLNVSAPTNRTAPKQEGPQADIVEQVRENRRRLTNAVISAPDPAAARSELHEAIRRVQSITLKPRPVPTETAAAPPSGQPAPQARAEAAKPAHAILSPEKLEQLKGLKAAEVADPITLADALVCSGHHDLAFPLYEQLLGDAKTAQLTQAWLLFQMANCKRQNDPTAAVSLYSRLLTEHPKSPWAGPGKVYKTLLEWRQAMNPEAILESLSPTPTKPAPKGNAE